MHVSDEELARRRAAWKKPEPRYERGYGWMFTRHIKQANEGCDFDLLETTFGAPVDEPSIYKPTDLTLRRAPLEYLGVNSTPVSIARGNPRAVVGNGKAGCPPQRGGYSARRDASLRDAPQGEVA